MISDNIVYVSPTSTTPRPRRDNIADMHHKHTMFSLVELLLKIQRLVDPDKHPSSVVNTMAFFFREGVWRHGIFVSRRNVKERETHVSRKSCII